ncbi:MAG: septal ring lytic transglycosylase RlpA family protein [Rickettsiales bacterium]|jgi:rare lipoprotein A (peptidoglycan hydrolase)|nr:septal ring lytic transglycosylase RlpA family protein [Rickettsiales bacterium]
MKKILALAIVPFVLAACEPSDQGGYGSYNTNDTMNSEETLGGGSLTDSYLLSAAPKYYIGTPFKIENVQHVPAEDLTYNQTGIVGIIPSDINGIQTTNGEIYDENQMVATSKTLPLPTIVRVTNLSNGQSAILRVNNRGPFVNSRIMDVSSSAARKLGISGQTKVQVQVLAEQSTQVKNATLGTSVVSAAPVSETGPYSIQVAAFYSEESANSLARRLGHLGNVQVVNEAGMHKVRIVGLDAAAARSAIDTLRNSESMSPGLLKDGKWINADSI